MVNVIQKNVGFFFGIIPDVLAFKVSVFASDFDILIEVNEYK